MQFTFHYVSIKSEVVVLAVTVEVDLHSTMYLLNLAHNTSDDSIVARFTFHYVSIKSVIFDVLNFKFNAFTFHYVSIESLAALFLLCGDALFTFHYVSIKSLSGTQQTTYRLYLHSTMYLLNQLLLGLHLHKFANLHSTMYLLNPYCDLRLFISLV